MRPFILYYIFYSEVSLGDGITLRTTMCTIPLCTIPIDLSMRGGGKLKRYMKHLVKKVAQKEVKKEISAIKTIQSVLIIILFTLGLSVLYAWTGPTASAPNGNIPLPLNAGTVNQVKDAGLGVTNLVADTVTSDTVTSGAITATSINSTNIISNIISSLDSITIGSVTNQSAITAPKHCIGTSCITSWPTTATTTVNGACTQVLTKSIRYSDGVTQYCDGTSWQNVVTPSGWVEVPLNDGNQFDENCDYKFRIRDIINGSVTNERGVHHAVKVVGQLSVPSQSYITTVSSNGYAAPFDPPMTIFANAKGSSFQGVEWMKKRCE